MVESMHARFLHADTDVIKSFAQSCRCWQRHQACALSTRRFLRLVGHCGGAVEVLLSTGLHVGAADTVSGCMCFVSWSSSVVPLRTDSDII